MSRRFLVMMLLVSAIASTSCRHDDRQPLSISDVAMKEVEAIERTQALKVAECRRAVIAAASDEERSEIQQEFASHRLLAIDEMLAIAKEQPSSSVGLRAAIWVVTNCDSDYGPHVDAAKLLFQHHRHAEELRDACPNLDGFNPIYEQLLRAVAASSASRETRGNACFFLADLLAYRADFRTTMDATPKLAEERQQNMGKEVVAFLEATDRARDREEAMQLYGRVQEEYANLPYRDQTLGDVAAKRLAPFEQTYPEIGKAATDIVGHSLDGKHFALSGYRGKVVVVTFWASWCGPCMSRIPEENLLVNELKNSPFALLGVNGDQAVEDARAAVVKHGIEFDSWWDDRDVAPTIVSQWGVSKWPTTFVLDKSGVIRYKDLSGPELRAAVAVLLDEDGGTD